MGRGPLKTYAISYDSQYKASDHRSRILRRADGPNLSKLLCLYCLLVLNYAHICQSIYLRRIPLGGLPTIFCRQGLIPLLTPATCGILGGDLDGLLAVVKLQSPSSSLCSWLEARESDRDELEREWGDESVRE